jgi:hypothetical protein
MRPNTLLRTLLLPAVLLAAACDDTSSPVEPPAIEDAGDAPEVVPVRQDPAMLLGDRAHWADGYTIGSNPTAASYTPYDFHSFNRSGGPINIRKPDGTTGRYIVTFTSLSEFLGNKSTVHVSAWGGESYCKTAAASLVSDKIEVRCFRLATGQPANAVFTLLVTRSYPDLAFAFANKPTSGSYAPTGSGSFNPVGGTTVTRDGTGRYQVSFNRLGGELPPGVGGHVQVGAVGTGNSHCAVDNWGPVTTALTVDVRCYTAAGALTDSKFSVLFLVPTDHLAYAWADQPSSTGYAPMPFYASDPSQKLIWIGRDEVGKYRVNWTGAYSYIIGQGNAQVSAYGSNARCTVMGGNDDAIVACFGPNGAPVDTRFTVLLGS